MQPVLGIDELQAKIRSVADAGSPNRRTVVGVAGAPASGKSTTAAMLAAELSAPIAPMDGFHLSDPLLIDANMQNRKGAPETFDVGGFRSLLKRLATDDTVYCPNFDRSRSSNSIGSDIRVGPDDDLVIVEGNYLLLDEPDWAPIKDLLTLSVYIEIPQLIRLKRLATRHMASGRSRAVTWEFIRTSDEPNARRIAPSKARADLLLDPSLT